MKAVLLGSVLIGLAAGTAQSQEDRSERSVEIRRGTVAGLVLDAETGEPLVNAMVLLSALPEGAVPGSQPGDSWHAGRTAVTDYLGQYHFADVASGHYRLLVRRLGYQPTVVEIDLRNGSRFRVSVGLEVAPILLEPAEVAADLNSFARVSRPEPGSEWRRMETARARQDRYISTDVRAVTYDDVVETVTLGETDLFRALQKLPGVSTRDDYTAELWTRGAPWSQTRVYFDGLPLFNPLHTSGVFSGISPDVVGSAVFYPGIRSPALGEGAAGAIDITSRRPLGQDFRGLAELSMVSARAALSRGTDGGRGGWLVAGRRSHVDLVTGILEGLRDDSTIHQPYAFYDLTARWVLPVGTSSSMEFSALAEWDEIRGTLPDYLRANVGRWGNTLAQTSLVAPLFGTYSKHTIGFSRFKGSLRFIDPLTFEPGVDDDFEVPSHFPTENEIVYLTAGSELLLSSRPGGSLSVGYQLATQRQQYQGPDPREFPLEEPLLDTLRFNNRHTALALWADQRSRLSDRLTLQTGVRLESSSGSLNLASVNLAPRLGLRYAVADRRLLVSLGWARSFQYTQAVASAGPPIGPDLHLTDFWLTASDTVPAIRSDVVSVGAEYWIGSSWLAAANLYGRRTVGEAVSDPTPGLLLGDSASNRRPVFVPGETEAAGVELSLRRLVGRWTTSLSYSWGSARQTASGLEYAAPADRRHVIDGTGMVALNNSLKLGASLTVATGAPFTRVTENLVPCAGVATDSVSGGCTAQSSAPPVAGNPMAQRTPSYATLDLMFQWSRSSPTWGMTVFVQLRNVLNRTNAVTYVGSVTPCSAGDFTGVDRVRESLVDVGGGNVVSVCDKFDNGIPTVPLLGLGFTF